MLKNHIINYLDFVYESKKIEKVYKDFCFMTGKSMETRDKFKFKFYEIFDRANDLKAIISYYIAFINSQANKTDKMQCVKVLINACEKFNIQYEIVEDDDGYSMFPKGVKELDDALVSEP